jgi:hypothetical protein
MAFKQLDILLGRSQGLGPASWAIEKGLSATSPDSLFSAADFLQVADGFSLDLTQEMTAQKYATGQFDQHRSVPGTVSADAKITTYLDANANSSHPYPGGAYDSFQMYLECSGMTMTQGIGIMRTYQPVSDYTKWMACTLHKYTGDTVAGPATNSLLTTAMGVMFNGVIKGEIGKPLSLELTGKGAVSAMPANVTYPTGPFTQLSDVIPAVLKAQAFTIAGATYKLLTFEWDFGNKIELVKDMTAPFGFAYAEITDMAAKWKAKVYESPYGSGDNPFADMAAGTITDIGIVIGQPGSALTLGTGINSALKAQITAIKQGNENGINTWDLDGIVIGNDWGLIVNDSE